MSHTIIDRTLGNKNKSSINRQKFLNRASRKVKEAVKDYIANDADIKDIANNKSKRIKIKTKTLDEPIIVYDSKGNNRKQVYVGNKDFVEGDRFSKPSGESQGKGGAGGEDSEIYDDEFYFNLSHDEFLDIFLEDLELPFLVKKQLKDSKMFERHPAGYSTEGPPPKMDLRKSMFNSLKRKFALSGGIDNEIRQLEEKINNTIEESEIELLKKQLEELFLKKKNIPFIQELDLRYRKTEIRPVPAFKAVVFYVMDVSGSMTQWHKEISKRFFMLMYMFLTRQYDNVDIVFIKHHHEAYEVDEEDFFYSKESGGTIVSKSFQLVSDIIKERYDPNLYNIYICQASDGDNYGSPDEETKLTTLIKDLLKKIQYFAYIEIDPDEGEYLSFKSPNNLSALMEIYNHIQLTVSDEEFERFNIRVIENIKEIYQVFRSLFEHAAD